MEQVPDIRFNRICSELVIGNKAIASKTGPMRIPDFNSGGGCKADPSCLRASALTLDIAKRAQVVSRLSFQVLTGCKADPSCLRASALTLDNTPN